MHERIGLRLASPGRAESRAPAVSARNSIEGRANPSAAPVPVCRKPRRLTPAPRRPEAPADGMLVPSAGSLMMHPFEWQAWRAGGELKARRANRRANASVNVNRISPAASGAKIAASVRGVPESAMLNLRGPNMAGSKESRGEKTIRGRIELCRVTPGCKVRLEDYDTEWGGGDLRDRSPAPARAEKDLAGSV